jgi:sulfate transport system permease protein
MVDDPAPSAGSGEVAVKISQVTRGAISEPRWLRWLLLCIGLGFLLFFLALPLLAVFVEAFASGWSTYQSALSDSETLSAISLTVFVAVALLPFNLLFGIAAAWYIARFDFRGKSLLITLIDLPFAVSPVVVGLAFLLIFGAQGVFGPWLSSHEIKVVSLRAN